MNDEQLNWLISLGTDIFRVIIGSLSMIMSTPPSITPQQTPRDWMDRGKLTLVFILYALLDRVRRFPEDGLPDICVYGHKRGQEADFAFGCFGGGFGTPDHELEDAGTEAVA